MSNPSTNQQISVVGINRPAAVISPAAFEAKRAALQLARSVTEVVDASSQEAASAGLATVKNLINQIESARKDVKAPVIEIGKQIDQLSKDFVADLENEARRLSLLVGSFQEVERRKAQLAREEAARKEQDRIWQLQEEERKRTAMETQGRTGSLLPDLDAIRDKAAQDVAAIRQEAANAAVTTTEGTGVRKSYKFEVTDINALFKSHPELCVIEPNNAAIRAIVKHKQSIPGLRIWSESAAFLRGSTSVPNALPAAVDQYDY